MGRRSYEQINGWAKKEYVTHQMSPGRCVSKRFRRADGRSHYHFNITWVPGTVSLSGDVGELSLVHYAALKDFRTGMEWVAGGAYDYLMGKAPGRHREYDREGTVDFLVELANSEIADAIKDRRDELRRYRQASAPARSRYREDYDEWFDLGMVGAAPMYDDYDIPDKSDFVTEIEFRRVGEAGARWPHYDPSRVDESDLPGNCHLWFAIWNELDATRDPEDIFTAKGRREIRKALERHLGEGGQERAAEFASQIGLTDYYGSEKWTERTVWQIEALRHGARMIVAELEAADRKWRHLRRIVNAFKALRKVSLRRKLGSPVVVGRSARSG